MSLECDHGQLARACPMCEYESRIAEQECEIELLRKDVEMWREVANNTAKALAKVMQELAAIKGQEPISLDEFAEWFCRQVPAGTVIGDPGWWAGRIFRKIGTAPVADKDAERLDWLEALGSYHGFYHTGYGEYRYYAGKEFGSVREVIDAAMAKGE